MKIIKKLFKLIAVLVSIILLIPLSASIYIFTDIWGCSHAVSHEMAAENAYHPEMLEKAKTEQAKIPQYHRPEESTFLTFPEWEIVYLSQEYAQVLDKNLPSDYPYFSSISQFWKGYCHANALSEKYPFNVENHVMIMVIGTSITVEYLIKGLYENTLGRFSEWTSDKKQVPEDIYAHKVANDYAALIPLHPWYEFSFWNSFKGLWSETTLWGDNAFRKWERKIILSMEYSFKAFYAWVIEKSTHATFGVAQMNTMAWVHHFDSKQSNQSEIKSLVKIADGSYLVSLPRYQPFTAEIIQLVNKGVEFYDIAGNQMIMLSAIVPKDTTLEKGQIAFAFPILVDPKFTRVAIITPVSSLHEVIKSLQKINAKIEHIYDY